MVLMEVEEVGFPLEKEMLGDHCSVKKASGDFFALQHVDS